MFLSIVGNTACSRFSMNLVVMEMSLCSWNSKGIKLLHAVTQYITCSAKYLFLCTVRPLYAIIMAHKVSVPI